MGLYSEGLIIGRIFAFEIWGAYFWEGLFFLGGGGLIIGILQYVVRIMFKLSVSFLAVAERKIATHLQP